MTAVPDGDDYILNGEKTWISNGGIADIYTLFARTGEAAGARSFSLCDHPGPFGIYHQRTASDHRPHPLATLRFEDCRVPNSAMISAPGQGFKIAMSVLDVFRPTVAAAALGFARRAFDEALTRVSERHVQGAPLLIFRWSKGISRIWR